MSLRSWFVPVLAALSIGATACDTPTALEGDLGTASAPLELAEGAWQVHFSSPGTDAGTRVDTAIDETVIAAIDGATDTLDLAVYDFDHPGITSAVLRAQARGVSVRFVGHGEQAGSNGYKALAAAGVPMVLRSGSSLMHHKFLIADGAQVSFGSFNFTTWAADWNDENQVFVESPALAAVYQGEFDQMWAGNFGRRKVARATRPVIPVDGGSLEVTFSPKEQTSAKLREVLATAQHRVYFMIFSFTLADVASDIAALRAAGVEVVGIFDKGSASNQYSQDEALAAAGVSVYLDGNENTSGFAGGRLHDKVLIVDAGTGSDPLVVTGSYNWSAGATNDNDENLVVMRGQALVAPYVRELCRVHAIATPVAGAPVTTPSLCLPRPIVRLTEVLANPVGTDRYEEMVEIANLGDGPADLSGMTLSDAIATRHVFAAGTVLPPKSALVVWSGASAVQGEARLVASSGQLSLNNDVETITLRNIQGAIVDQVVTGVAVEGESLHRDVMPLSPVADADYDGALDVDRWAASGTLGALLASPGARPDGSPYDTVQADPEQGGGDDEAPVDLPSVAVSAALPNPVGADRPYEYVELRNDDVVTVDLSGWAVGDLTSPHRHVFAPGTLIAPGQTVRIWDGAGAHVRPGDLVASSGALSLNNDSDAAHLVDAHAELVSALAWKSPAEGVVVTAP
ncbi:MAG: lamin tail domain-containing protein [Deltaproteobacteria bacterium]|nr:lamin tail domain-containing protein [Deltaproteobacteria bacterium]